jgi:hypothetical protein
LGALFVARKQIGIQVSDSTIARTLILRGVTRKKLSKINQARFSESN